MFQIWSIESLEWRMSTGHRLEGGRPAMQNQYLYTSSRSLLYCTLDIMHTVDHEIFAAKISFVNDLFQWKLNTRNILCNVRQPIPILVTKVWQQNLDYAKNLQAKYFTGENIPINLRYVHVNTLSVALYILYSLKFSLDRSFIQPRPASYLHIIVTGILIFK